MLLITFSLFSQNVAYNEKGQKRRISSQNERITLTSSEVELCKPTPKDDKPTDGRKLVDPSEIISFAKEIFTVAYNISVGIAEGRIKKFSSEYEKEASVIDSNCTIPNIEFERSVELVKPSNSENPGHLKLKLTAHEVNDLSYFYYTLDEVDLSASKAKTTRKSNTLDYSFAIQITYLIDSIVKTIEAAPFQVKSVKFGLNKYENSVHRTDLIPLPENAHVLKVGIKIVESNPEKVDAQRNLDSWKKIKTENEDAIEKIFKLILEPKEES